MLRGRASISDSRVTYAATALCALFLLLTAKFTKPAVYQNSRKPESAQASTSGEVADKKTNLQFSFSLSMPTTKLQSNSILTETFNGDKTIINLMKKERFQQNAGLQKTIASQAVIKKTQASNIVCRKQLC